MEERIRLEIPTWSIVKTILVLLAFYFLFLIKDIIALFFFVMILVAAFNPVVDRWEKTMRRTLAVLLLFALIFLLLAVVIYIIAPPVIDQLIQLSTNLPSLVGRFHNLSEAIPSFQQNLSNITQSLGNITGGFISITTSVFGGLITILTAMVLTAYLLIEKEGMADFVVSLVPVRGKEQITTMFNKIGHKLGSWFRGQMILGAIIALLDLIGLLIIGVPYALAIALISGLMEIIPTIGPILAGVIATLIAFTDSPLKGILVAVLYIVIQQIENNFIVPKVMQKAVGLSPVIIIFAILIGAKLLGIAGAILAVPLAASISVVAREWPSVKAAFKS